MDKNKIYNLMDSSLFLLFLCVDVRKNFIYTTEQKQQSTLVYS